MQTKTRFQIDWLALAVARMGGIAGAARRMRVKQRDVRRWFDSGIGELSFAQVVKIAELGDIADVPFRMLARAARRAPARGPRLS